MRKLEDSGWCFACGPLNPSGLRLDFELEARGVLHCRFVPGPEHQSFLGNTHGGLVSVVLDELMVRLPYMLGIPCVSVDLHLRLHRPTLTGRPTLGTGWIKEERGRLLQARARLVDEQSGDLLASARGTCVKAREGGWV